MLSQPQSQNFPKQKQLKELKTRIERMSKYHQSEILRIFVQEKNVHINENKNGTFINLTELNDDVLVKLEDYTRYVEAQQRELSEVEQEKERIETQFFHS
jgi:CTP-dependent riboflavin kinase